MSGHTRLWRRDGATYYFRAKVPVDLLKQYCPKLEIKFSLKTNDRKEAVLRVRAESVKLDEEFGALRNGKQAHPRRTVELSPAQVQAIGGAWLARWLESDEEARSRGLSDEAFDNIENWTGEFSEEWRSALASGDTSETLKEAGELVNELIPAGSISAPESVRRVAFELLKQRVVYLETLQERQTGNFAPAIDSSIRPSPVLDGSPLLSEVFAGWAAERKPPAKTLGDWQKTFDMFEAECLDHGGPDRGAASGGRGAND